MYFKLYQTIRLFHVIKSTFSKRLLAWKHTAMNDVVFFKNMFPSKQNLGETHG